MALEARIMTCLCLCKDLSLRSGVTDMELERFWNGI